MAGDRAMGAVTFPIHFGERTTVRLVVGILSVTMIIVLLPYFFGIYTLTYLILVIVGVETVLAFSIFALSRRPLIGEMNTKIPSRISFLLKLDMIVGMAAIYFGR